MKRRIIVIDETKCDGCGLCISACHEGALALVDGKARLVTDSYCDGLGDCLGECPQGAITFEEREADAYDEAAVARHLNQQGKSPPPAGCPGLAVLQMAEEETPDDGAAAAGAPPSALCQWPIQLHLVPVAAPYWQDSDILVAADCVAYAQGGFHPELLKGKRLVIACPKLDDTSAYADKLAAIFSQNEVRSVTVAHMEVPCCTGIVRIVEQALAASGKLLPCTRVKVGIRGDILETVEKES